MSKRVESVKERVLTHLSDVQVQQFTLAAKKRKRVYAACKQQNLLIDIMCLNDVEESVIISELMKFANETEAQATFRFKRHSLRDNMHMISKRFEALAVRLSSK